MERRAALLLILLIGTAAVSAYSTTDGNLHEKLKTTSTSNAKEIKATTEEVFSMKNVDYKKLLDPKETLLKEIQTLDEEISNDNDKFPEEEVAKVIKAEAQKIKPIVKVPLMRKNSTVKMITSTTVKTIPKEFTESDDANYDDDDENEEDENDDDDDDYDEDDDDDDEDDDDDDDDEDDPDHLNEDEIMTQCPSSCKCVGQFAAATTAKCTRLDENQTFGPGIVHLMIENADPIRLGPKAFKSRGLQQLESITFIDTPILELDKTAFEDNVYLFAVNFTRNSLDDIPVDIFQNNSQLNLITISGNPMKRLQTAFKAKTRNYLLNAPSVSELVFSDNSLSRLPHSAFVKMPNLVFIDLKTNRLKTIDKAHINSLESLTELDISYNELQEIPIDLFEGSAKNVQILRAVGNNLSTLSTVIATKMTILDVSSNRIKIIHKDDLIGLPILEQLYIKSNGLKRIHQHSFSENDELVHLDISDNKLTSLTDHHFRTNARLQTIVMNDNPGLETLPVFRTNDQEYNTFSVYRFECSNCGLYSIQEGTFDAMPALTTLKLAKNHLTGLPRNLLKLHSSLIEFDLSKNQIKTLDNNMFQGATSLIKLNLAGNLLISLQVTPFLATPNLSKLNVSWNVLERVWSEARVPLKNLKFLAVHNNRLQRITLEELKATPKLTGLDIMHNPLKCDQEFNDAIQWLTGHRVKTVDNTKSMSIADDYIESEGITQWSDLAKVVCDSIDLGPPPRPVPHRPKLEDILKNDLSDDIAFDHGQNNLDEFSDMFTEENDDDDDYNDDIPEATVSYHPFYRRSLWPVLTVIVVTVVLLMSIIHFALYLAKRRGRGPVIRPPMILRQGLTDNKNCGLVYKPLQEEIPTPHLPKRGAFYSSSTFHYDKIVPESV